MKSKTFALTGPRSNLCRNPTTPSTWDVFTDGDLLIESLPYRKAQIARKVWRVAETERIISNERTPYQQTSMETIPTEIKEVMPDPYAFSPYLMSRRVIIS